MLLVLKFGSFVCDMGRLLGSIILCVRYSRLKLLVEVEVLYLGYISVFSIGIVFLFCVWRLIWWLLILMNIVEWLLFILCFEFNFVFMSLVYKVDDKIYCFWIKILLYFIEFMNIC